MSLLFERILFVDDDIAQNYLNVLITKKALHPYKIETLSFDKPVSGLEYIAQTFVFDKVPTVLFLDLRMPELSGWDFLDKLKTLDVDITKHITTYVLSSSIDPTDIKKAATNPLVKGFLSKPINTHLARILEDTLHACKQNDRFKISS